MSVRNGMMALLAERPMPAYQLRQEFEHRTGGTWPLNIGQVWTTLQRLVRDDLAEPVPRRGDDPADAPEPFRLTDAGREEVAAWWRTPVSRSAPARDELAIKLAIAVTAEGVDVAAVVQAQRTETLRCLHDYTRLKARDDGDLAWSLVLDNLVFSAEAEVRWLDHVEARVMRAAHDRRTQATSDGDSGGAGAASAQGADAAADAPPAVVRERGRR